MSYRDDYTLFLNLMGQSPEGLGDPMLIGKFSKAKFQLNQMQSMAQNPVIAPPQPLSSGNGGMNLP
jgi:hypothetical protein